VFKGKVSHISALVAVTFLVVFANGCGTQPHISTDNTGVQNTPTPIPTTIPFDLDSPKGVAQAIAGDPMVHAASQRFDAQTLDTPALVWYQNGRLGLQLTDRDHWVVTSRDAAGRRSAIYDFRVCPLTASLAVL
jgi:hypothetical protein